MAALNAEQRQAIQKTLGQMASPLYSTLAKLYLCGIGEQEWRDTGIWGAVSVIIDRTPPMSRHLKIFDMQTFEVRFSQEVLPSMAYSSATEQFHTFEADNVIVGLSFSDAAEANEFHNKVKMMIAQCQTSPAGDAPNLARSKTKVGKMLSSVKSFFGRPNAPAEIGRPTDVVHKQHIGFNPETGFDTSNIPAEWQTIFKNAGVRKRDLKDPEAAKLIFDTLQSSLGAAAPQFGGGASGGPPPHAPPSPGAHDSAPSAPSSSSSSSSSSSAVPPPVAPPMAPPLPSDAAAPPVAPPVAPPAAPPMAPAMEVGSGPAAPPMAPPTAPPMAPPIEVGGGPDAPPMAPGPPSAPSAPSAPTAPASARAPAPPAASKPSPGGGATSGAALADHLKAIQGGFQLRKIPKPSERDALPDVTKLNKEEASNLTNVLQRAMQDRFKNIAKAQAKEDESDDEWD